MTAVLEYVASLEINESIGYCVRLLRSVLYVLNHYSSMCCDVTLVSSTSVVVPALLSNVMLSK